MGLKWVCHYLQFTDEETTKSFSRGCSAGKWWGQDSNPGSPVFSDLDPCPLAEKVLGKWEAHPAPDN